MARNLLSSVFNEQTNCVFTFLWGRELHRFTILWLKKLLLFSAWHASHDGNQWDCKIIIFCEDWCQTGLGEEQLFFVSFAAVLLITSKPSTVVELIFRMNRKLFDPQWLHSRRSVVGLQFADDTCGFARMEVPSIRIPEDGPHTQHAQDQSRFTFCAWCWDRMFPQNRKVSFCGLLELHVPKVWHSLHYAGKFSPMSRFNM